MPIDRGQPLTRSVDVPTADGLLAADLAIPARARGMVLFAHGSGSSRLSPRNQQVAAALRHAGYGTLLLDLLTELEERMDLRTRQVRFDIPLLARRLTGAADWLTAAEQATGLSLALFGASTGAAAALITAADRPEVVRALISRGGRPDLAGQALSRVRTPTLFIVGGADHQVLELNRVAADRLGGVHDLAIVPNATHLFGEPGALEQVTNATIAWLDRWIPARSH